MEKSLGVETISELQIWIEGKFALIAQMQDTAHTDLTNVRKTVHDLANHMSVIIALNLPDKITKLETTDKEHQALIDGFIKDAAKREGMVTTLKAVYIVGGALIGGVVAVALKLYTLFQA